MAAKFKFEDVRDYFKNIHREGQVITEELLSNELDKFNLKSEQLNQVREYLESLELSDEELDSIINWYNNQGPEELNEKDVEILDDEIGIDDSMGNVVFWVEDLLVHLKALKDPFEHGIVVACAW